MSPTDSHTVWSSDSGDLRKKEQNKPSAKSLPPNQQTAYLHRELEGTRRQGRDAGQEPDSLRSGHVRAGEEDQAGLRHGRDGQGWRDRDPGFEPRTHRGGVGETRIQDQDGGRMIPDFCLTRPRPCDINPRQFNNPPALCRRCTHPERLRERPCEASATANDGANSVRHCV